jgi:glycosyltransferase involved in cell wall biosynthesis
VIRVLFINRSYWPDTEATGQLLTELCEDLAQDSGLEIHVLCGLPNHVAGEVEQGAAAIRNGVQIHRLSHSQFPKRSTLGKLLNLLSFTWAAWRYARKCSAPDVVITETDPFFAGLVGRSLQKRTGCRFIAYLQDIYPDVAVAVGKAKEGPLVRFWRKILFDAYRAADRVIVLSRDMKERCVAHGIDPTRIEIIPNWIDTNSIRPLREGNPFRRKHGLDGSTVVMYSGNMGLPHLLTPLLDAAERLLPRSEICFLFVGDGVQKQPLKVDAERRGLRNVRFLPYQPKSELPESLSAADIQVVSVKPGVIHCLMPSKLYGILAAGCGVLAIAPPSSELGSLVVEESLGEVVDCDSNAPAQEIADAILRLANSDRLKSISDRGPRLAAVCYSRELQAGRFRQLLSSLIRLSPTSTQAQSTSRSEEAVVGLEVNEMATATDDYLLQIATLVDNFDTIEGMVRACPCC